MTEIILALDTPDGDTALRLLDRLDDVRWVKVGSILFAREGPALVRRLVARSLQVFLDLKWHDIPNTVHDAAAAARDLGVRLATVHTLGGAEMMAAAARGGDRELAVVGVTVLTSHTPASFGMATGRDNPDLVSEAIRLGHNALEAGLAGVVCSPLEARAVRNALGAEAWLVVPGIRRGDEPGDDQSRTATPAQAVRAGATHLVVGRPVLRAPDPSLAWATIVKDVQCEGPLPC